MQKFFCGPSWYPPDEWDDAKKAVEAPDERTAAEDYVESNLADLDYPRHVDIRVQPHDVQCTRVWNVEVRSVPEAFATLDARHTEEVVTSGRWRHD